MKRTKKVIVIGGGPAGMMAAGRASEFGASVALLEKTDSLGSKLLITGKDRCNFTNISAIKEFIEKFGNKGNFLYPAFYNFFNEDLAAFLESFGVPSKTERGGRMFPVSDKSEDVLKAMEKYMEKAGVSITLGTGLKEIICSKGEVQAVKTKKNDEIHCSSVILCTGGLSYPETGSTGDGYKIAKKLGHTVIEQKPALVPLETKEKWTRDIPGLSLENVNVIAKCGTKKIAEEFGDMLFTHYGVSGPVILMMSREVGRWLEKGPVILSIDLKPALDLEKLDDRVQRDFRKFSNKSFGNSLDDLLPKSLIPAVIALSFIPENKVVNTITREERRFLSGLLKALPVEISATRPIDEAIVTSGGIALDEIDHRTMGSKIIKGLYFAGEVLDLDAPTGGYNLQMAFSTGRLAGESAAK